MNKYFKKFSIMFVVLLTIIGVGAIQNGDIANAATVGQKLTSPEDGWKRFDDRDSNISYQGSGWDNLIERTGIAYRNYLIASRSYNATIKFNFYGSKLRIIDQICNNRSKNHLITIDGIEENLSEFSSASIYQGIAYEKLNLSKTVHHVVINNNSRDYLGLDAIDIDSDGYLQPYTELAKSISLDNSTTLLVDTTQQLAATTTPAGAQIEWSSDNTGIVTVEQDGTIKGISVGTATIIAKIKGSDIKAICAVTVKSKGSGTDQPVDPTNPGGTTTEDGNLFIELVDGQIKSYQVTASQIEDFKQWYLDRDNTKSNKPYYHFTKGSYNDYVIHDKIDWFEVR